VRDTTTAVEPRCEVCGRRATWYTLGIVPNGAGTGVRWLQHCDEHKPKRDAAPDAAEDGAQ